MPQLINRKHAANSHLFLNATAQQKTEAAIPALNPLTADAYEINAAKKIKNAVYVWCGNITLHAQYLIP